MASLADTDPVTTPLIRLGELTTAVPTGAVLAGLMVTVTGTAIVPP